MKKNNPSIFGTVEPIRVKSESGAPVPIQPVERSERRRASRRKAAPESPTDAEPAKAAPRIFTLKTHDGKNELTFYNGVPKDTVKIEAVVKNNIPTVRFIAESGAVIGELWINEEAENYRLEEIGILRIITPETNEVGIERGFIPFTLWAPDFNRTRKSHYRIAIPEPGQARQPEPIDPAKFALYHGAPPKRYLVRTAGAVNRFHGVDGIPFGCTHILTYTHDAIKKRVFAFMDGRPGHICIAYHNRAGKALDEITQWIKDHNDAESIPLDVWKKHVKKYGKGINYDYTKPEPVKPVEPIHGQPPERSTTAATTAPAKLHE